MPQRVLIVDDDPVQRTVIRSIVPPTWEVLEASSAMAGLQIYWEWRPALDLVILDMELPYNASSAVLDWMRALDQTMPIISTAHIFESTASRSAEG
jgi:CheY-like chemotaxis protein